MEVSRTHIDQLGTVLIIYSNMEESGNLFMYFSQGVAATEVEVDTLTGDHTVLRVDIHVSVRWSVVQIILIRAVL